MKTLDLLKKALHEDENEFLKSEFQVSSNDSHISFAGIFQYTGESKLKLELKAQMPEVIKHFSSEQSYDSLSEQQFKDAQEKIQNALEDVLKEYGLILINKLASYGLKEGEN